MTPEERVRHRPIGNCAENGSEKLLNIVLNTTQRIDVVLYRHRSIKGAQGERERTMAGMDVHGTDTSITFTMIVSNQVPQSRLPYNLYCVGGDVKH